MPITIQEYTADLTNSVREFNRRLAAAGVDEDFYFPESHIPEPPPGPGHSIYQQRFLAVEPGYVRGGFMLRHQEFGFSGEVHSAAHYRLPVSEGIINRAYTSVAIQILRQALKIEPALFALGMGGLDKPLPRLLKSMGWDMRAVPFYFKVVHPRRFLRHIQPLRRSTSRKLALDIAAFSGTGWLAIQAWHRMKRTAPRTNSIAEPVGEFGAWTDQLWEKCKAHYGMSAVRDSRTLQLLYPSAEERFLRLKISQNGEVTGWVLMLDTQMHSHKQFGDMRVGTIVDCMARPASEPAVIRKAVEALEKRGVDMILSNQAHSRWCRALEGEGFLEGPSNYVFAASKALRERIPSMEEIHINRGDGDGPIHL